MESVRTTLIVLRRTDYRESDLIISGVSPDCGRLELIAGGARKIGEKKFPVVDLFCELEIEYVPAEEGLARLKAAELLTSFANVADQMPIYRLAGKVAALVLKQTAPDLPMALSYDALRNVLGNLALYAAGKPALWLPEAAGAVIKMVLLQEAGLLPEFDQPKVAALFDAVIEAGIGGEALPEYPSAYWAELSAYLNTLFPQN